MSFVIRAACAASAALALNTEPLLAETSETTLPAVVVESPRPRPVRTARPARPAVARRAKRTAAPPRAASAPAVAEPAAAGASRLTAPTTEQARLDIQRTPGAVAVVPDTAFKTGQAATIKDVVDYVPGVWAQPKWGDDARLSIRGSGLSRNFHLRGVQLYMDGIPINTSDGYGDFQEIDPTAYRHVEIFKGANALRFGANSLGGAINFVMPTGRDARAFDGRLDAGSFGYFRSQASTGGANGPYDFFVTGSAQRTDGYRDHSWGESERGSANFGYQASPDFETRFYLNANHVRQRIPGEVTRTSALTTPQAASTDNVVNDWQRNIDTVRVANRSVLRLGATTVEFGAFGVDRHLMHPIFQWLDYRYADYGTFGRAVDDRMVGGFRNRLVAGVNVLNGRIDANQYVNIGGNKGAPTKSLLQKPENYSAHLENAFYVRPDVALVAGTQFLYAVRDQQVNFSTQGDVAGRAAYSLWSPKAGVLWDVDPTWQVFGNVSRSAEAPSFGESVGPSGANPNFPTIPFFDIKAQTATTVEIGTRGRRPTYTWDLAVYRAEIQNELQCFYSSFGNCNVTNADRTVHQGIEAAVGVSVAEALWTRGGTPDRVWLNLAYTLNDFRYDHDATFGNNALPGAPPHYLRAELLYKHPSGLSFGPNIEWVPESYYVDSANTLKTDPYLLWGFKAVYDDGKDFSAYVEARNLTDRAYIASTSIIDRADPASRLFNPGTGRSVFAGVRGKW